MNTKNNTEVSAARRWQLDRMAKGLCGVCGRRKIAEPRSKTRCRACLDADKRRAKLRTTGRDPTTSDRRKAKTRRDALLAAGLCIWCGRRKIIAGGRSLCLVCLRKTAMQRRRRTGGLPWRKGCPGRPPIGARR